MKCRVLRPVLLVLAASAAANPGFLPDRRRSQFSTAPGWAVVPYVYSLPGIGLGYGVLGAATNVGGSNADFAGTAFIGDADGQALSADQVYLIPKHCKVVSGLYKFRKVHRRQATYRNL